MHYERWKAHGDPLAKKDFARQFFDAALVFEGDACLPWVSETKSRYISLTIGGRRAHAHRVICEKVHGAPPTPTHQAAHNCGNRRCVNPKHIRWATPAENTHDKLIHGTWQAGEAHPRVKLSQAQVDEIRSLAPDKPLAELVTRYGVSKSAISAIRKGRAWKPKA